MKNNIIIKFITSIFLSFCCYSLFGAFNNNFMVAYFGGGIVLTVLNFIDDNNK